MVVEQIERDYGIKMIQVVKDDKYCQANGLETYLNRSMVAGTEVYLGIFEDHELKILSFFHEIGHILDQTEQNEAFTKYDYEKNAWDIGYQEAKRRYGVDFSDNAKKWASDQLETYYGWEIREMQTNRKGRIKLIKDLYKRDKKKALKFLKKDYLWFKQLKLIIQNK